MEDLTKEPITDEDVTRAKTAIRYATVRCMASLPPELGVEMGNILRCLTTLQVLMDLIKKELDT